MTAESLYERLADHFNHFIVGAPRTNTLVQILQILFPPDEAEVALHMPVMHKMTPLELQAAMPSRTSRLPDQDPVQVGKQALAGLGDKKNEAIFVGLHQHPDI